MKLKLIAIGIVGAFSISIANAEHHGKGVIGDDKGVIAVDDSIGATLSAGYMTHYIFYGVDLGRHGVWTGVDYSLEDYGIPIDVGVWYINPADGIPNDELDVYASTALPSFAGFDASLNFLVYFFPESGLDATYELNLVLSRSLGYVDWDVSVHYDFEIGGWYFQTGLSKEIALIDDISMVLRAGVGGQDRYNADSGFWNDVTVTASFPIALTDTATLEPYVGGLFALDAIDDFQDDLVHGGVSLSVSF